MKIAILGGTFDPIHNGHLHIAKLAADAFAIDKVLFIPTGHPPHKACPFANGRHRLHMTQLAIESDPRFAVSDLEVFRDGTTYTIDTLRALHEDFHQVHWHYIIGADTLAVLDSWREFDQVCKMCSFIVALRPGNKIREVELNIARLMKYGADIHVLDAFGPDISSTTIRSRAAQGESLAGMVPEKVADYIDQYHFYQNALLRDAILNWLRQNLSLKRYRHVLGVEHSAVSLAMRYGADENQASLAALLHDCAKEFDFQTLCDLVKRAGLDDPDFAFAPHLMHAPAGSIFAREQFGVTDEAILHAICVHTLGCDQMSLLDKILFLADVIEPSRCFEGVEKLREAAFHNLNQSCLMAARGTMIETLRQNSFLHPQTLRTYNHLLIHDQEER